MKKDPFKIVVVFTILYSIFYIPYSISHAAIPGCFCDSSSSCYSDGCTRKTIKSDNAIDYGLCGSAGCGGAYSCCYDTNSVDANRYFCTQQPPCCFDMVARNDPEACCWPERGYCHPFYCNQVSRTEKCGWYWVYHGGASENGYGCTKGTSSENLKPIYGIPAGVPGGQPTQPPPTSIPPTTQPTVIPPTSIPTPTTVIIPTYAAQPTNPPTRPPIINPTQVPRKPTTSPSLQPTNTELPINIGNGVFQSKINNSITDLKINIIKTAIASKKVLDLPKYAGNKIISLDQQLEIYINNFIRQLFKVNI